jgi:hypothetical protein
VLNNNKRTNKPLAYFSCEVSSVLLPKALVSLRYVDSFARNSQEIQLAESALSAENTSWNFKTNVTPGKSVDCALHSADGIW